MAKGIPKKLKKAPALKKKSLPIGGLSVLSAEYISDSGSEVDDDVPRHISGACAVPSAASTTSGRKALTFASKSFDKSKTVTLKKVQDVSSASESESEEQRREKKSESSLAAATPIKKQKGTKSQDLKRVTADLNIKKGLHRDANRQLGSKGSPQKDPEKISVRKSNRDFRRNEESSDTETSPLRIRTPSKGSDFIPRKSSAAAALMQDKALPVKQKVPSLQGLSSDESVGNINDGDEGSVIEDSEESEHSDNESASEISEGGKEAEPFKKSMPKYLRVPQPSAILRPTDDFQPASLFIPIHSELPMLFSQANLIGKQIWHITVPASIPIDAVKELPLETMLMGETAFSYRGADYGFVVDSKSASYSKIILLPRHKENDYKGSVTNIAKTVHLQQILHLSKVSNSLTKESSSSQSSLGAKRSPPQQPQGLKMRYRPFGVTKGTLGKLGSGSSTSQDEAEPVLPQFCIPFRIESSKYHKKRKIEDVNAVSQQVSQEPLKTPLGTSVKKRKKNHANQIGRSALKVEDVSLVSQASQEMPLRKHQKKHSMENNQLSSQKGERNAQADAGISSREPKETPLMKQKRKRVKEPNEPTSKKETPKAPASGDTTSKQTDVGKFGQATSITRGSTMENGAEETPEERGKGKAARKEHRVEKRTEKKARRGSVSS